MHTCIIIDDEQYAIDALKGYIQNFPGLIVRDCFTDPVEALIKIKSSEPVSLILLDIDMPKLNGLELSREVRKKTDKLVFTTAHTKYGYEAFKVQADDYLLKPYTLAEFVVSMNNLFPEPNVERKSLEKEDSFLVKSKEENLKLIKINFSDVVAVESKSNYIMIHTVKRKVLTYMSLSEFSKKITGQSGFLQFQRSFLIAEKYIDSITGNSIKMTTGLEVTVGEHYRKTFSSFISERILKSSK
ncbi:LytR/AlgR family response regulator transcription factor [Pedobacter rhodius]|uniref:LytTR family DNA-binding domain-containing protein n=1 Tax=Pedobacter rhodius TaxID=3004098 RepID=A0ABT4KYK0_9SPHI|nr:LytTR family DNA-binding domain-containing protein [Pedobacter sp. SJ11]MCZ4224001.1 LytTR family DNA-binding domain-containing protein [Pedobacter sp. SJ11]